MIRDLPRHVSNFRAQRSLSDYLKAEGCVAIAGIDTRRLTRLLRTKGAQNGAIVAGSGLGADGDVERARRAREELPGPRRPRPREGRQRPRAVRLDARPSGGSAAATATPTREPRFHVVAFDYGVKHNILRMLAERGCRITVLPAQATAERGAGARARRHLPRERPGRSRSPATTRSRATRDLIERGMPTFGICLGHQIMALASGGRR